VATNPPITIGELVDVPAPGSGIKSAWSQEVTRRSIHRFATVAERDAKYPAAGAGNGAVCITLDTGTVWAVLFGAWTPVSATPTVWQPLTLTNGWVAWDASYTPKYRKVGDNVQLRGLMKDGANASPFTLPVGYRPVQEETFVCFGSNQLAAISVGSNGAAAIQVPTLTGTGKYVYLSAIIFSTVA
jgi:hypothetical protein